MCAAHGHLVLPRVCSPAGRRRGSRRGRRGGGRRKCRGGSSSRRRRGKRGRGGRRGACVGTRRRGVVGCRSGGEQEERLMRIYACSCKSRSSTGSISALAMWRGTPTPGQPQAVADGQRKVTEAWRPERNKMYIIPVKRKNKWAPWMLPLLPSRLARRPSKHTRARVPRRVDGTAHRLRR